MSLVDRSFTARLVAASELVFATPVLPRCRE